MVESNIPVLHSLSSEGLENFTKIARGYLIFFSKHQNKVILSHQIIDFKNMSGSENLSGLNDLNRHDNITGLNELNSLFGL